jgi:hypothetical protein
VKAVGLLSSRTLRRVTAVGSKPFNPADLKGITLEPAEVVLLEQK